MRSSPVPRISTTAHIPTEATTAASAPLATVTAIPASRCGERRPVKSAGIA